MIFIDQSAAYARETKNSYPGFTDLGDNDEQQK